MFGYLVVVIVVASLGVFGNILVLATLIMDRKLHVLNNLFIGNLAVADLFIAGIIHPFTAIGIIGGREYLFYQDNGQITFLCQFLASFCIISCSASVLSIGAVAMNRYVYICHNQVYSKIYTPCIIPVIVVGIWLIGALIDLPTYLGFGNHIFHERIYSCFFDPLHPQYKLFFVTVGILSPVALTVYCYVRIVTLVFKSNRRLQKHKMSQTPSGRSARNPAIKSADVRLLKTVAAMAILAVIIYTPFAITLLADRGQVSRQVWMFSNGLMHSFSCMDWLIYAATNNRIRDGFALVFKKHLCRCWIKESDLSSSGGTSGRFSGTAMASSDFVSDTSKSPRMLGTSSKDISLPELDKKHSVSNEELPCGTNETLKSPGMIVTSSQDNSLSHLDMKHVVADEELSDDANYTSQSSEMLDRTSQISLAHIDQRDSVTNKESSVETSRGKLEDIVEETKVSGLDGTEVHCSTGPESIVLHAVPYKDTEADITPEM